MDFFIFLGWIFFAFAVGMFASIRRNRDGIGWGLLALIISPLFAFILIAVLKELPEPDPINLSWPTNSGSLGVVLHNDAVAPPLPMKDILLIAWFLVLLIMVIAAFLR